MTLSARNWAWDMAQRRRLHHEEAYDVHGDPTDWIGLKSGEKLVLLCLAEHESAEEGYAYPSYERVSQRTGLSVRSVQTHVHALEAYGILEVDKARGSNGRWMRNVYVLRVPEVYRDKDDKWRALQG